MVTTDSFMDFPQDILTFLKSNTLHEDAGGGALVEVAADEDETFASPDDTCYFGAFGIDLWWKLELPDEVDELIPLVFFNH